MFRNGPCCAEPWGLAACHYDAPSRSSVTTNGARTTLNNTNTKPWEICRYIHGLASTKTTRTQTSELVEVDLHEPHGAEQPLRQLVRLLGLDDERKIDDERLHHCLHQPPHLLGRRRR